MPLNDRDFDPRRGEIVTYPYCAGCGHRFKELGLVAISKAKRQDYCHLCVEDAFTKSGCSTLEESDIGYLNISDFDVID